MTAQAQPERNSIGSFMTAPEQLSTSAPRSTVLAGQPAFATSSPLYEEPQDTQVEAVADEVSAGPSRLTDRPALAPRRPTLDGADATLTPVSGNADIPAATPSTGPMQPTRPPQQQQHVSYAAIPTPSKQRTPQVPLPSASFPPVLPTLPGEGHMSGPYPSLRPYSAFEPLQPNKSVLPSSTLLPSAHPSTLDAQASTSSFFPETAMVQHRQSKSSLNNPSPVKNAAASDVRDKSGTPGPNGAYIPPVPEPSSSRPVPRQPSGEVPPRVQEPEICVECMMRDQDMADVHVGPETWARASDIDFYDALAAYEEDRQGMKVERKDTRSSSQHHSGGGGGGSSSLLHVQSGTSPDSEESGYAASASAGSYEKTRSLKTSTRSGPQRKRVSPGNRLMASSLESWNNATAPVSNFRWTNLLAYLQEQSQYLDPDAVAAEARRAATRRRAIQRARAEREEREAAARAQERERRRAKSAAASPNPGDSETTPKAPKPKDAPKLVSSSSSPNVVQQAEREAAAQGPYLSPALAASNASMPILDAPPRRFSSPMPEAPISAPAPIPRASRPLDSSLPSPGLDSSISRSFIPRAQSPSAFSERPRSMWSNLGRFKRNNGSMFSLAPSGASMMDMHLGLSVDRHQPSTSYEQRQRAVSHHDLGETEDEEPEKRKRKKGIKKFISKLFVGPRSPRTEEVQSPPLALDLSYLSGDSNEPLEPPVPSYLAASGPRHDRSASSSSQSSLPHSPKDPYSGPTFRRPPSFYYDQPASPADSTQLLTTQQLPLSGHTEPYLHRMSTDKPLPAPVDLEAPDASPHALRREKSLPSLPGEDASFAEELVPPIGRPYSQPSGRLLNSTSTARTEVTSFDASRSAATYDDNESIGGGRKSRARTKIFTRPFMKRKESKESSPSHQQRPSMISKEDFVALYYPSSS